MVYLLGICEVGGSSIALPLTLEKRPVRTLLFSSIVGLGSESLLSCCLDLLPGAPDDVSTEGPLEEGEDSCEEC